MTGRVLVVDDEPQMRLAMTRVLSRVGYSVDQAGDGEEALEKLRKGAHPVVISDVRMPRLDGMSFLGKARMISPESAILMITAYGTVESAVEAVRRGARDYILKPFPPEVLQKAVGEAFDFRHDPGSATLVSGEKQILTLDPVMKLLLERARRAASSDATILLEAESGAGKELLARFIHRESGRSSGPFVAVNCAAFPNELLEAELFGHTRGAFTGAIRERRGHFESANGGTLLLDEIGEMSSALQAKLLRVLQEREIQRLGEESPRRIDVRVVASTNRDLGQAVRSGSFREDLYFRLSVIPLRIPPLRERPGDIQVLAEHFCRIHGRGSGPFEITPDGYSALRDHGWPGNVRELENVVHRAVVLATGRQLERTDFFPEDSLAGPFPAGAGGGRRLPAGWSGATLEQAERMLIEDALERTGGNRTRAAALLGISVRTIRNKLREWRGSQKSAAAGGARQDLPTDS